MGEPFKVGSLFAPRLRSCEYNCNLSLLTITGLRSYKLLAEYGSSLAVSELGPAGLVNILEEHVFSPQNKLHVPLMPHYLSPPQAH